MRTDNVEDSSDYGPAVVGHHVDGPSFDDGGPCRVSWPEVYDETSEHVETTRDAMAKGVVGTLVYLHEIADVREAWKRASVLGFVLRVPGAAKSYRELGHRIGCSHTHARALVARMLSSDFAESLGFRQ